MGKTHFVYEVTVHLRRDCCQEHAYKSQVRVGTFSMSTTSQITQEGKQASTLTQKRKGRKIQLDLSQAA